MATAAQTKIDSSIKLSEKAQKVLPKHVAIIMDGNGRWAKQRNLPRVEGHRNGVESVRQLVRTASDLGIDYITLYAFSVENWNRPKTEVDTLMMFLGRYISAEADDLVKNNIQLKTIGQLDRLPPKVQAQIRGVQDLLANNTGLTLIMALSYGGRTEIIDATKSIAAKVKDGTLAPDQIDEQIFSDHLYTAQVPDPDLLIRTSGEMRVSNFLLWQISYSEFVSTQTLWPDFRKEQFYEALEEYAARNRRYGGI